MKSGPNLETRRSHSKSNSESRSRRKSTEVNRNRKSNNENENQINENNNNNGRKILVSEENLKEKHVTIKVDNNNKTNSKTIMSNEDATKMMILESHKDADDFACPFGNCTEFDLVSLEAVVEHLKVSHQNLNLTTGKHRQWPESSAHGNVAWSIGRVVVMMTMPLLRTKPFNI